MKRKANKLLFQAVINGDTSVIEDCISHGVDVNTSDQLGITALMLAARMNKTDVIRTLIEYGADVEAQDYIGRNAITYALKYGNIDAFGAIIDEIELKGSDFGPAS